MPSANMDLYRIFLTVAKTLSISQAARELFVSQPAVSQSIAQLETRLSCKLFIRTPRGVILTHEGDILYGYIDQAVGLVSAAEERIAKLRDLLSGSLKIGASDTLCHYFILPFLRTFHEQYPDIQLEVTNRTTTETVSLLKSGQVDIGFVNLPVEDPALSITPCGEVHDAFVAGDRFRHLEHTPLDLADVAALPLILLEEASNSRRYVSDYARSKGVTLVPEIELGAHALLVEFARIGLGVACVTREFAGDALRDGELFELPLRKDIPSRQIGLIALTAVPVSFAAKKFAELVLCDS